MNRKNKLYGFFTAALTGAALLLSSCLEREGMIGPGDVQNNPAVNAALLSPLPNESGTVKAYIGTEVTAPGFNLDRVSGVSFADVPAEITGQTIKELKFKIPALDLAQSDLPYSVKLKVMDSQGKVIFNYDYFVSVPVTDAIVTDYAPTEGTVGSEITLTGRNLEQITRIHFGAQKVEAADFTLLEAETLKFLVPAGSYAGGMSEVAISAEWGTQTIDVTGGELFKLYIPKFDALTEQPAGTNSKIGEEIDLTGENLDRVDSIKWGAYRMTITEQSATAIKMKFPASIQKADPVVQTAAINAYYGAPAQSINLSAGWRVDTTPTGPAKPTAVSMTPEDGGADKKFFLAKTVTVVGENLSVVEAVELQYNDGTAHKVAATVLAGGSDSELKFTVPEGVTFDQATEVNVVALYNGGDESALGKAMIYPFYYFKDVTIGAQDPSNNDVAFFVPDLGRNVNTDGFAALDPTIGTTTMSGANVLNKAVISTAQMYYSVPAYIFCTNSSANVLSFIAPSNSSSQIKNFKTSAGTALPTGYGTAIVGYRNLDAADATDTEKACSAAVKDGSLISMADLPEKRASSGAPNFDAVGATNNRFAQGQVLLIQQINYTHGQLSGATADAVHKSGYIWVTKVEGVSGATGARTATITFDMYWSKTLNE